MKLQLNWLPALAAMTFAVACSNAPESVAEVSTIPSSEAPASVATSAPASEASATPLVAAPSAQTGLQGTVLETMDAGGYTYVQLETASGKVWAAGPLTAVELGQRVQARESFPMADFSSAALNRTFKEIYFCSAIELISGSMDASKTHMQAKAGPIGGVQVARAEGGQTVEEVIAGRDTFVGEAIMIRGRVAKFSAQIMGKNWIHLRDGSGAEGTNDLTITTASSAEVGDIVLVKGTLSADKDFGYGYVYDLIVEDAEVTVE